MENNGGGKLRNRNHAGKIVLTYQSQSRGDAKIDVCAWFRQHLPQMDFT